MKRRRIRGLGFGRQAMPRERRPLIEPGILGGDVFSRILANDRRRRLSASAPPGEDDAPVLTDPFADEAPADEIAPARPASKQKPARAAKLQTGGRKPTGDVKPSGEAKPPSARAMPSFADPSSAEPSFAEPSFAEPSSNGKRPRGRPRKPPTPLDPDAELLPPRGRGRPSKRPSNPPVADMTVESDLPPLLVAEMSTDARKTRLHYAMRLAAQSPTKVLSLRLPSQLVDYMDEFVAQMNQGQRRQRYHKQDALIEAFAAFVADHPLPQDDPAASSG